MSRCGQTSLSPDLLRKDSSAGHCWSSMVVSFSCPSCAVAESSPTSTSSSEDIAHTCALTYTQTAQRCLCSAHSNIHAQAARDKNASGQHVSAKLFEPDAVTLYKTDPDQIKHFCTTEATWSHIREVSKKHETFELPQNTLSLYHTHCSPTRLRLKDERMKCISDWCCCSGWHAASAPSK